jgi:alpha/beta superfamily hydrolase
MIAGSITTPADVPTRYLLISYPLSVMWALTSFHSKFFKELAMQRIDNANDGTIDPILFIMGDRDQFTGLGAMKKWIGDKATERTTLTVVPDGDHFWFGMEDNLVKAIHSWLQ